ncbi:EndoU domain-containing protein [Nostoc sp. FACHB-87]|uniref:EndoU domain-containing protein n=1 Tax=Nostocaceae TaxID=1162 RepID=UPI00168570C9|nr:MULTISPECIES: EndoU domain-containing protein [Nostocaceae]MBD2457002.1 EndoU domain-containing protein [Nostoc sp. FACHB-87]MBD2477086.1 EndoU domain-containing protein [Anabaena sp. FACHB-83]
MNPTRLIISKLTLLAITCIFGVQNSALSQSPTPALLPFFDDINNPVPVGFPRGQQLDISPKPPILNAFDGSVLKTCGAIGTRVQPNQFKQLLLSYPNVLRKIQQASGGEIRSGRRSQNQFLEDLTNVWFKNKGFEHIFCGEIYNANDIGGLHFAGRYLQLQNSGMAGRLPNNQRREEVVPGVIYTLGVVIKQNNRTVTDVIKGYSYLSNAEEMLIDATRAFKLQGNQEGACIYNVRDSETGTTFPTVFVRKNKAIVTFYPDATPQGTKCRN